MKLGRFGHAFMITMIDLVIFAVCLLSFSWFHHAKRMLADNGGDIVIGRRDTVSDDVSDSGSDADTDGSITSDSVIETTAEPVTDAETEPAVDTAPAALPHTPVGTESSVTETVDTEPVETTPVTTAPVTTEPVETEPPAPQNKFESAFAPEGTVEKTDTSYRSHDIYINIDKYTEKFEDSRVVSYFVIDVYVRSIDNIYTVSSDSRYFMEELCEAGNAIVAISGDFWYQNAHIAVRGGELLKRLDSAENDFCVMYTDGSMKCFPGSALPDFEVTEDVYQVWNFGPSLLDDNGHALESFGTKRDIAGQNPRSSIGYYEPGHYCFVVCDGRVHVNYNGERVKSYGFTLRDLSALYEKLGCVCAYNLDGGDSAYAYFDGEVIRQDYSRAHSDDEEPRKIYDIICIGER